MAPPAELSADPPAASPGDPRAAGAALGLTVVILTLNEAQHIARAIGSVERIADNVLVVDSGSTDGTVAIARGLGATVLTNPFVDQASQFNWALDHLPQGTRWVLRLDADEILMPGLAHEIATRLPALPDSVAGVFVARRMTFLRRPIRHGGIFPARILRLLRAGRGRCEKRFMDEHIRVSGDTADFAGEILDDNLNSLTWWTAKHNGYASREVVDLLNIEHNFAPVGGAGLSTSRDAARRRWLKENVYARLPAGFRALAYFLYRYVLRLGFLDGREGAAFHVLQGFWYRYLVDAKLHEVRRHAQREGVDIATAIERVLGIDVRPRD